MRKRSGLIRRGLGAAVVAGTLATGMLTGLAPATPASAATPSTVTWAEAPQTPPNYIFPFMSLAFFSVSNINQFQFLMFRPLYWFGDGATPNLNPTLSVAKNPVYTNGGTTITINLKPYKWSNGESLTSQDVMFWMNMLHAEKANWAGYAPGTIPDDIKTITIDSPTQLTFTLTSAANSYWYTYNELSQITPMPVAWDKTSTSGTAGSGGCSSAPYGTADTKCAAVYTFLSEQSGYDPANPKAANDALPTYATNPLWQVVDGPYHLTSFNSAGNVTLAPNPDYSGPVKATTNFQELPFTSDSAEFNSLVGGKLDIGYLPTQDITKGTSNPLKSGPNNPRLASNFTLYPLYTWSINYFPLNFDSTGDGGNAGKIFKQLYFRQAFQTLVDQSLYISRIEKGYGVGTYGPVPTEPSNPFASKFEKSNPYPYNLAKAKSLLTSHGWKVVPNGTDTCIKPGSGSKDCGTGIAKGAKLNFNIQFAGGTTVTTETMSAEKSSWAAAGINVTLSSASFNTVIGNATPCPKGCSWEMQNWGGGWVFAPDYYPTGEDLFQTGAGSNSGDYENPTADNLIKATDFSNVSLTSYENFLAKQLPVIFQPNPATQIIEVSHSLKGVLPQNPLFNLTPEYYRFK